MTKFKIVLSALLALILLALLGGGFWFLTHRGEDGQQGEPGQDGKPGQDAVAYEIEFSFLIDSCLTPVQCHLRQSFIHDHLTLSFRKPEKRIRLTALLIKRYQKLHIEFHIFTSKYFV